MVTFANLFPPFSFLILLSALMPSCPLVRLMRCAVIFGLKPPSESASFLNHHQLFPATLPHTPHPPVAEESAVGQLQHARLARGEHPFSSDPTPFKGIFKTLKIILNFIFSFNVRLQLTSQSVKCCYFAHVRPHLRVYFALSKQIHLLEIAL